MSGAVTKLNRAVGSFHYKKWTFLYRYHQTYGQTATPFFHFAVGLMVFGMFNDSHRRNNKIRGLAYNSRRERVQEAITKGWLAERDQQSLNISELEASVYRGRTGAYPEDLLVGEGKEPWPAKFAGLPFFHDGSGSGLLPKAE